MMNKNNNSILGNMEIAAFCDQLSMIVAAGISLYEGVSILSEDAEDEQTKVILSGINASLEQGVSFHEALSASDVFPKYVIDMIEIGETTGKLEEVLKALATYYRREDSIRNSIKNAVTYPIIMIVLMFVIIFVMIAKVLPVFQQIYGELGSQLTGVAGAFMRFSMVLNRYMLVIVLLLAVAVVALVFFFKSNHGKRFLQKKTYAMALATGRFANCMSLAMSSGLDTDQGLLFAEQLVDNPYMAKRIRTCSDLIASGKSFAEAILSTHIFDRVYVSMISIGFRTGTLDEVMAKISEEYEDAIENRIAKFIAILEPTLVIILSVVIGIVLISFLLPLIGIMSSIG